MRVFFTYNLILLLTVFACSGKKTPQFEDWELELTGVGYAGKSPDSLFTRFTFFPSKVKQPEYLNLIYKSWPKIKGDTITFSNFSLQEFFSQQLNENESLDSSKYLVSREKSLFKFKKISGLSKMPSKFYFKRFPQVRDEKCTYFSTKGKDRWGIFDIRLDKKDSLLVELEGFQPSFYYSQKEITELDRRFIFSYLNALCASRYDTLTSLNASFSGVSYSTRLVYNDSLFLYDTYFESTMKSSQLLNYFRSKVDDTKHTQKSALKNSITPDSKSFSTLPIALQGRNEIYAPPRN